MSTQARQNKAQTLLTSYLAGAGATSSLGKKENRLPASDFRRKDKEKVEGDLSRKDATVKREKGKEKEKEKEKGRTTLVRSEAMTVRTESRAKTTQHTRAGSSKPQSHSLPQSEIIVLSDTEDSKDDQTYDYRPLHEPKRSKPKAHAAQVFPTPPPSTHPAKSSALHTSTRKAPAPCPDAPSTVVRRTLQSHAYPTPETIVRPRRKDISSKPQPLDLFSPPRGDGAHTASKPSSKPIPTEGDSDDDENPFVLSPPHTSSASARQTFKLQAPPSTSSMLPPSSSPPHASADNPFSPSRTRTISHSHKSALLLSPAHKRLFGQASLEIVPSSQTQELSPLQKRRRLQRDLVTANDNNASSRPFTGSCEIVPSSQTQELEIKPPTFSPVHQASAWISSTAQKRKQEPEKPLTFSPFRQSRAFIPTTADNRITGPQKPNAFSPVRQSRAWFPLGRRTGSGSSDVVPSSQTQELSPVRGRMSVKDNNESPSLLGFVPSSQSHEHPLSPVRVRSDANKDGGFARTGTVPSLEVDGSSTIVRSSQSFLEIELSPAATRRRLQVGDEGSKGRILVLATPTSTQQSQGKAEEKGREEDGRPTSSPTTPRTPRITTQPSSPTQQNTPSSPLAGFSFDSINSYRTLPPSIPSSFEDRVTQDGSFDVHSVPTQLIEFVAGFGQETISKDGRIVGNVDWRSEGEEDAVDWRRVVGVGDAGETQPQIWPQSQSMPRSLVPSQVVKPQENSWGFAYPDESQPKSPARENEREGSVDSPTIAQGPSTPRKSQTFVAPGRSYAFNDSFSQIYASPPSIPPGYVDPATQAQSIGSQAPTQVKDFFSMFNDEPKSEDEGDTTIVASPTAMKQRTPVLDNRIQKNSVQTGKTRFVQIRRRGPNGITVTIQEIPDVEGTDTEPESDEEGDKTVVRSPVKARESHKNVATSNRPYGSSNGGIQSSRPVHEEARRDDAASESDHEGEDFEELVRKGAALSIPQGPVPDAELYEGGYSCNIAYAGEGV